jgi:tyrosinase
MHMSIPTRLTPAQLSIFLRFVLLRLPLDLLYPLQDKMRFTSPLVLSLIAGTLSNALPAPQDEATSTIAQASLPTAASSSPSVASEQVDELAQFAQQQANATLADNASKRGTCNIFTVAVRREWGSLSKTERKAYTDAVLCLQSKKSNTPASLIPGAKSRFDDWVGTHINQTLGIHYTGTFLGWHRYFTWHYEQALRNECGYKGYVITIHMRFTPLTLQ